MDIQLINIGFGNIVSANRVVAIVSPESAPIKRIITDARDRGQLIDATYGRRTRAVIITDSSHVILSAIQPETVANRFVVSREPQAVDNWLEVGCESPTPICGLSAVICELDNFFVTHATDSLVNLAIAND